MTKPSAASILEDVLAACRRLVPAGGITWTSPDTGKKTFGHYLCEGCWDAMTDLVVPDAKSPTGVEMALCAACQAQGGADDE